MVLDRTTFYPEAGGQVSDKGLLSLTDGLATFEVEDVQSLDSGHVLHVGRVTEGCLQGIQFFTTRKTDINTKKMDIFSRQRWVHVTEHNDPFCNWLVRCEGRSKISVGLLVSKQ